jgi:ribosomal protein S27AE
VTECLICQAAMEETVAYVTECCGAEMEEGEDTCPLCGAENPIIVADDPRLICENCGYRET